MASVEVLSTQNDSGSPEFNDYSLLPEVGILDDSQKKNSNQSNNDNFNFTNMQSALIGETLPDSSVEVHSQMTELIEENNRLKEMLNKNNSILEDFEKAKEKVSSLENENSELYKKLVDMEQKLVQGPKSCMQCTTLDCGLKNMLGMDYIEDNQVYFLEWSYFRENLYGNLSYICQQLEIISRSKKTWEEQILLKAYALMLKYKIAFIGELGENAPFASLRTDEETGFEVVHMKEHGNSILVEELKRKIDDKDRELSCLKMEKEKCLKKIEEYASKVQEYEATLKFQCELLHHELQALKANTPYTLQSTADASVKYSLNDEDAPEEELSLKCDGCLPDGLENHRDVLKRLIKKWKEQIKECELKSGKKSERMSDLQLIQELEKEILVLKERLEVEQQGRMKDKEKLTETMTKCENLQVDYDRVTKILEIQSRDEKKKDLIIEETEAERKRLLEESDHLTAQLITVQQELSKKRADRGEVQDPDKKLHSPVYRCGNSEQRKHSGGAAGTILCPLCNEGFADERSAQYHVNRCLEENK